MARSPRKKGDGKKKGTAKKRGSLQIYAVSKGIFTERPVDLIKALQQPERVLPRLVLYKQDLIYLLNMKPHEATRLITYIRNTENTLDGRWVFIRELSRYTGVPEERVYCYLLSLTVKERILS